MPPPANRSLRLIAWAVIAASTVISAYSLWQQQQSAQQNLQPVSLIIAQQLADAAAPLVLDGDQLSLQALSAKLSKSRLIRHVAIYDLDNDLLAQSGKPRLRSSDILANGTITLQNEIVGHTQVALRGGGSGAFPATQTLIFLCLGSSFVCLLLLTRRPLDRKVAEPDAHTAANQPIVPAYVEHAFVAVELLKFPLLRKRLNEDTLYEYIATFQHWLRRVADLFAAEISVENRGFTLTLQAADKEHLAAQAVQCAYTMNEVLNDANPKRKQAGELIFEMRIGVNIATRRSNDDAVLQQLYVQEAERAAWQACEGKVSGSVSLTHSVAKLKCANTMQLEDNSDDSMQLVDLADSTKFKLGEQIRQVLQHSRKLQDSTST